MQRAALRLSVFGLLLGVAGCKNTLTFGSGGGQLACDASGAICSLGAAGNGDGGDATAATLLGPRSLSKDAAGNIYIGEYLGNRIRKIDPAGKISTIAGTGQFTSALQFGLPATQTPAPVPSGVTVLSDGSIVWADDYTCSIYSIDPVTSKVSWLAGTGYCSGEGGADFAPRDIRFDFYGCIHISEDGTTGNLIIPDGGTRRVRYLNRGSAPVTVWGTVVPPDTVSVIAGNGDYSSTAGDGSTATVASIYGECDALPMADGSLIVTDVNHHRIRRIDAGGLVSTIAGTGGGGGGGDGGPATAADLYYPYHVAPLGANGLMIADESHRIRVVNLSTAQALVFGPVNVPASGIDTLAGQDGNDYYIDADGQAGQNQVFGDDDLVPLELPNGDVLVADSRLDVLRTISHTTGVMTVSAGLGAGGTLKGFLAAPSGVAVQGDGTVVAVANAPYVWRVASGSVTAIAGNGSPDSAGEGVPATTAGVWGTGITWDPVSNSTFVADGRNNRIRKIDATGNILTIAGTGNYGSGGDGGPANAADLGGPLGVAVDSTGNVYVLCDDARVRFISVQNTSTTVAGLNVPALSIVTIAGGNGGGYGGDGGPGPLASIYPANGPFHFGTGIAVDGKKLYFTDFYNNRIRRLDLVTGIIETAAGTGIDSPDGVGGPQGLAVHGGYLYWTQRTGSYVKRMKLPYGPIELVAGSGADGWYGDNGLASSAQLVRPVGLAISADGRIYVADGSHRVREIHP